MVTDVLPRASVDPQEVPCRLLLLSLLKHSLRFICSDDCVQVPAQAVPSLQQLAQSAGSQPPKYGPYFPIISVGDMINAQFRLLSHLGMLPPGTN